MSPPAFHEDVHLAELADEGVHDLVGCLGPGQVGGNHYGVPRQAVRHRIQ